MARRVGLAVALGCLTVWPAWRAWADAPQGAGAAIGGPFRLVGGDGRVVTDKDFLGHYLLLFFGYTGCPDECPLALSDIARALTLMGSAGARVHVVFVTIDPARDTPAVTARYALLFSPAITGLSGTAAQIRAIVTAYHVFVGPTDAKTGAIAHGALIYLMGPDGRFLEVFDGATSPAALSARVLEAVGASP